MVEFMAALTEPSRAFGQLLRTLSTPFSLKILTTLSIAQLSHFDKFKCNLTIRNYRVIFITQDFVVQQKVIRKIVSLILNQEWKDVRSSITPAFTEGLATLIFSKMLQQFFFRQFCVFSSSSTFFLQAFS